MERKKKPNGILISGLISALASLAIVAVAPGFAAKPDNAGKPEQSSTDTKGNDRKSGYEDNSKTPDETNHGKGADNDGDADGDSNTAYTEDNDTNDGSTPNNVEDDGDNRHPSGKDRSVENGGSGNQGRSESNPDDSKGPMRYEGAQGDDKPNGPGGSDLADQDGNNGCGNDDDFDDDNNGWCGKPTKVSGDNTPKTCPDGSTMGANGSCNKPKTCPNGSAMPANAKSCDEVKGGQTSCPAGTVMGANGKCETPPAPCDKDNNMANGVQACEDDAVAPDLEENPSNPDQVLGGSIDREENPARPEGPSVLGIRLSPALNEPVKVAGAVLPFTGGDVLLFLVLALALFASGLLIMRSTKAKTHTS